MRRRKDGERYATHKLPRNMAQYHKLDLGGTACYEAEDAISISDDGSVSGDGVTYNYVGDYARMPEMPSDHFSEALGSCFLESDAGDNDFRAAYAEVYRVLKPGALLTVKGCGTLHVNHVRHAFAAGFELVAIAGLYVEGTSVNAAGYPEVSIGYDNPWIWRKPLDALAPRAVPATVEVPLGPEADRNAFEISLESDQ